MESLSDVGVELAGSFDIRAILTTTHDAASRLAKAAAIDVLYVGWVAINSRPMWYPAAPSVSGLTQAVRDDIPARLQASPDELNGLNGLNGPIELEDGKHRCLPLSYQNERLGCLFVAPAKDSDADVDTETERLLSILTLQAATALRNIHLTQERIHFERLSAIGRMIGSVVHDFRSPLTALRGYAGMLTNLKLNDGERAAYGRYVIEECDRLNYMVSELLEFTRGGSFELEPASIHVRPFIEGFAGRVRAHFGGRGVRVELDLDDTEEIFIDKDRMDRALWNVATNACQAMPDGGVLRIRVHRKDDSVMLFDRRRRCRYSRGGASPHLRAVFLAWQVGGNRARDADRAQDCRRTRRCHRRRKRRGRGHARPLRASPKRLRKSDHSHCGQHR